MVTRALRGFATASRPPPPPPPPPRWQPGPRVDGPRPDGQRIDGQQARPWQSGPPQQQQPLRALKPLPRQPSRPPPPLPRQPSRPPPLLQQQPRPPSPQPQPPLQPLPQQPPRITLPQHQPLPPQPQRWRKPPTATRPPAATRPQQVQPRPVPLAPRKQPSLRNRWNRVRLQLQLRKEHKELKWATKRRLAAAKAGPPRLFAPAKLDLGTLIDLNRGWPAASSSAYIMRVRKRKGNHAFARINVIVTKKQMPVNAVVRNRARRRLREAVRLSQTHARAGYDFVVSVQKGALDTPFDELCQSITRTFRDPATYARTTRFVR